MAKSKKKLDRIDLDELFDSPVNRGMLSFLQRPPEEARERLREKERVDRLDSNRLTHPQGELPSVQGKNVILRPLGIESGTQPPVGAVAIGEAVTHPQGNSPIDVNYPLHKTHTDSKHLSDIIDVLGSTQFNSPTDEGANYPVGESHIAVDHPLSDSPASATPSQTRTVEGSGLQKKHPLGVSPRGPAPVHQIAKSLHTEEYAKLALSTEDNRNYPLGDSLIGSISTEELSDSPITKDDSITKESEKENLYYPLGNMPSGYPSIHRPLHLSDTRAEYIEEPSEDALNHPVGESLITRPALSVKRVEASYSPNNTEEKKSITPEFFDGRIVGRQQKIRRAVVAQDGHSSGEQLLYQSLWNAANLETHETRVLSVGYKGMSMLCKLDHSNCKKNIHNLIEKLAVEIIGSYDRATSTGTTYRLFSYKEILRRRESAGLLWVIRANGVKFVNTANLIDKSLALPMGVSHSGAIRNSPVASPGESLRGRVGKPPGPPVGEPHTQLGREKKTSSNQSSSSIRSLLQKQLPTFDHGIIDRLWAKCHAQVPDVTEAEVALLFEAKMPFAFERGIVNPNGFLLTAVATSCTRAAIDAMRRGRELAESSQEPEVIQGKQEQIANYESYLKALPNHPAAKLWRSKLDELREEG